MAHQPFMYLFIAHTLYMICIALHYRCLLYRDEIVRWRDKSKDKKCCSIVSWKGK